MTGISFGRTGMGVLGAAILVAAGVAAVADGATTEAPAAEGGAISIGYEDSVIRTGYLELNRRGKWESLGAAVRLSVQNRSGRPCRTRVAMSGKDAGLATVALVRTEETADGQDLHLTVSGVKKSTADSETFVTIEAEQDGVVKAAKSLPVRVVVPAAVKTGNPVIYEGRARPGLVNRALNMKTYPKAAVVPPEAKLASMCVHDLTMVALDQFGDPLPAIYKGANVFAALGESDYETTNRVLTEEGTWIDIAGLWQFVGEVRNMNVDPDRALVARFVADAAAPCTDAQYRTYEPLTLQWQIGGHEMGSYTRQITLLDSGDDHKPSMRITLVPGAAGNPPVGGR